VQNYKQFNDLKTPHKNILLLSSEYNFECHFNFFLVSRSDNIISWFFG